MLALTGTAVTSLDLLALEQDMTTQKVSSQLSWRAILGQVDNTIERHTQGDQVINHYHFTGLNRNFTMKRILI